MRQQYSSVCYMYYIILVYLYIYIYISIYISIYINIFYKEYKFLFSVCYFI